MADETTSGKEATPLRPPAPYRPAPGMVLVEVMRVQDGNVLGLGKVVEVGEGEGVGRRAAAGQFVLFRAGYQVSPDPLYRILAPEDILGSADNACGSMWHAIRDPSPA